MAKEDWFAVGEEIGNLVQDAVDRNDFSSLSNTIMDTINRAADGVAGAVNQAAGSVQDVIHDTMRGYYSGKNTKYVDGQWQEVTPEGGGPAGRESASGDYRDFGRNLDYHSAADRIRQEMQRKKEDRERQGAQIIPRRTPDMLAGSAMKWLGFGIGGAAGCALGVLATMALTVSAPVTVPGVLLVGVAGAGVGMGVAGSRKTKLVQRFRQYLDVMGERTYISIQELAAATGRSARKVVKDIRQMVRKGFFPQAYLDKGETTLMLDSASYQQYLIAQEEFEKRSAAQDPPSGQEEDGASGADLSEEEKALLREGKRYIRHVRECNDRIPGQEMSDKLDRLEQVVTRIFQEVEKRPQLAGDLRRMLNYYLPTTEKLLDAYCELDSQPVRGENMEKTKREIEASLDTINTAFENLLDSFFEHQAWDISSDISVLNTMFEQEGLTGKRDF